MTLLIQKWNLSSFMVTPFSKCFSRQSYVCQNASAILLSYNRVSSTHYTFLSTLLIMSFRCLVNASCAAQCPIRVQKYPSRPHGVMNVDNLRLSSSSGIWWYPEYATVIVLKVCFGTLVKSERGPHMVCFFHARPTERLKVDCPAGSSVLLGHNHHL